MKHKISNFIKIRRNDLAISFLKLMRSYELAEVLKEKTEINQNAVRSIMFWTILKQISGTRFID